MLKQRLVAIFKMSSAIPLFFLAGCATFSHDAGFGEVKSAIRQHISQSPVWATTDEQRSKNAEQVQKLLATPLSADDAVQIALLNNPKLQADFYDLQIAEANVVQVGRLPNPGFSMLYAKHDAEYSIEQKLSFNLMALLTMPKASEVEKQRFTATKRAVTQRVLALANETRRAYFDALAAKQRLQYFEQVKAVSQATADLAKRMQVAGNWSALDAARERAFYADTAIDLSKAQHQQVATEEALVRLLGLPNAEKLQLPERLPDLPAHQDNLKQVKSEDFANRLDLQEERAKTEALAQSLGLTKATRLINVLELGPVRTMDGRRGEPSKKGMEIRFELPIFDWGAARVKRAEAEYMQALQLVAANAIEAASEVRTSYDFYRKNYEIAQQYRDEILPLREKMLQQNLLRFNGMLISPFELMADARSQVLSVANYINALRDFWMAEAELQQAFIGKPLNQGGINMVSRRAFLQLSGTAIAMSAVSKAALAGLPELVSVDTAETQKLLYPETGRPYHPVATLNGWSLPWRMNNGVKEFHLVAEPVKREMAPGMIAHLWGYNGQSPGPTIEVVEGDRVRIFVTNRLPEITTIHWHGQRLPNGMDGVAGLTQPPIEPGKTYVYEFEARRAGTFMYHPHADEMTQVAMGMMGTWITHPKNSKTMQVDRDYVFLLNAYDIDPGSYTPRTNTMLEFNLWSFNSRVFPGIAPFVAKQGEKVRIRMGNLTMTNHPIHLHGHEFEVTGTGGGWVPKSARYPEVTVDIGVGQARAIEFVADELGDWSFHCHKSHHTMNAMGHQVPNMIGVSQDGVAKAFSKLVPDYMQMGETGMAEMVDMAEMMAMPLPDNTLPMMMGKGPFGSLAMGGMFTTLMVRKDLPKDFYGNPGFYQQPKGTSAYEWTGTLPETPQAPMGSKSAPTVADPTLELQVKKPGHQHSGH